MSRYLVRRVLVMVPTLLGITFLTFAVALATPGDPFDLSTDGALAPESIARQRAREGLDAPVPVQYLRWVSRVTRLDFGRSLLDRQPVVHKLTRALPNTLLVAGLGALTGFSAAIPLAVLLATRRARVLRGALVVLWSLPSVFVAVLVLLGFATQRGLGWLPLQGLEGGGWILPVACVALGPLIAGARQLEASLREALASDYVLAARARGVPEHRIIWRHALKPAALPFITVVGGALPNLLGGSVVVERVFGVPGVGLLAFEALGARDYPVVMGVSTMLALTTVLGMLLTDVLYRLVDPRARVELVGP